MVKLNSALFCSEATVLTTKARHRAAEHKVQNHLQHFSMSTFYNTLHFFLLSCSCTVKFILATNYVKTF